MKKAVFGFLLLTLAAAAKDREYKMAILVLQDSVSLGTHCSSSAVALIPGIAHGGANCSERSRRIYHLRVEGYDYVVAPDSWDPLAKIRPGTDIQYRLDESNHLWMPGKEGRRTHEAKYNVVKIGPKQEEIVNSDAVKSSPVISPAALANKGHELAASGAPAPRTSLPNTREQRFSVLGITAATWERGGAEIVEVEPGGVAEMAYLHVGDIINSLNGRPIKDSAQLDALLSNRERATQVRLGYLYRSTSFGYVPKETVVILGGGH